MIILPETVLPIFQDQLDPRVWDVWRRWRRGRTP